MKKGKNLVLILSLLVTTFMTGCWNYREIETLALVAGAAMDKGTDGKYHLSMEVLNESGSGSNGGGGGGGGQGVSSTLIEANGKTIFDAVRDAVKKSDKKLYWGSCKAVIISKELANEGIAPLLDFLNRDSEPRLTIDLFISKEDTAEDIIKQKSPVNPITSYALDKIDENDPQYLSKTAYVQLYTAIDMLGGEGEALLLPALKSEQNGDENVVKLDGTSVFKKDKLEGFLESDESRYMLFILDQVQGGLLLVNENSPTPNITLEIKKNKTKVTADLKGREPIIKIDVNTEVTLGEIKSDVDYNTEEGIRKVAKDAETTLENGIKQIVQKVQTEYDSDIFGFGNTIYQQDPSYWNTIKPKWDQVFKNVKVKVNANVEIINTALAKGNIKGGFES